MANPIPPDLAPPSTRIGHVHLKVADLDRAVAFYQDVLGLELQARYGGQGPGRSSIRTAA